MHGYDELEPGDKVVKVACVSWPDRRANLIDQLDNLAEVVRSKEGVVVGAYWYVGQRYGSKWIKKAIAIADRKDADWILAETADRFARNRDFHCMYNVDAQAKPKLLRELQRLSGDRLMTHLHPDATARQIRSYQRKRGQRFKNNKGGRPKKKSYRPRYSELPNKYARVARLRNKGMSWSSIAKKVHRARSTVRDWYERAN